MSTDVRIANPSDTIQSAARAMADLDAGFLPVGENDRLVGIVTDRDIAIRGVGEGLGPDAPLENVMSPEVLYCFEDEQCSEVLYNMADLQVRRLPVVNREKRIVGVVSLTDLASNGESSMTGEILVEITRPSGRHSQASMRQER